MTATLPIPGTDQAEPFKAGVYDGMPDDVYHGDPVPGGSLSASGAKRLLPPSCPAKFRYERDHGRPPKKEFDFGHAAHQLVLGVGPELVVVDRDRWNTNECKAEVAAIRERGAVPLKPDEYAVVQAMAAELRRHPIAGRMFNPERGKAEQSMFWVDKPSGVWRRSRVDWLPNSGPGRLVISDYKTCWSAAPEKLQRAMHDLGYATQAAWYLDGVRALGLGGKDAKFVFVCQEKDPPYVVTIAEPDPTALLIGDYENRSAIDLYAECVRENRWPGYSDGVVSIPLPRWVEAMYSKELSW